MKFIKYLIFILLYISAVLTFGKNYMADMFYVQARGFIESGNYTEGLKAATTAINLNPQEPAYYRERAKGYLLSTIKENQSIKITKIKVKALKDLKTAEKLNPKNLATLRNAIPLYYFLAVNDLTQAASKENIDSQWIQVTQKYFKDLKHKYPTDAGVWISIAKYEKKLNLQENYMQSIKYIKQLRPDLLEWHPDLL